jgi:hypothetical protein
MTTKSLNHQGLLSIALRFCCFVWIALASPVMASDYAREKRF